MQEDNSYYYYLSINHLMDLPILATFCQQYKYQEQYVIKKF
jgi:hypothetical protein